MPPMQVQYAKVLGKISGVNIDESGIYTSFILIPKSDNVPTTAVIALRNTHYALGSEVEIEIKAYLAEESK